MEGFFIITFKEVEEFRKTEQEFSDKQIIDLINFSIALDYEKKKEWRRKIAFLTAEQKQKLVKLLLLEKQRIKVSLVKKMQGVRGYYFARSLNDLELEFLKSL